MATTKVTTGGITDATIATADIADDAVTNAKIAAGAVGGTQLGSNAVTAAKIGANEVTAAAIAAGAVGSAKIADQAVTLDKLPHGTGSNDGKFLRANNGADPSFETVSIPAGTTINNNADNRVITGSGTTNTLEGESGLTYDGSNLSVTGGLDVSSDVKLHSNITVDNMAVQAGGTKNPTVGIPKDQLGVKDDQAYDVTDNGGAIAFSAKYHSNGSFTTMGSIEGVKNNNSSGDYGGNLVFRTRSNGSSNNIGMRLTNSGLCFGTDNAAANALDDYEEGTWSPGINSGTASFGNAYYTKIGRFVNATVFVSQMSPRTANFGIQITNLPFQANGTFVAPLGLHRVIGDQGNGYFAYISDNVTTIDLLQYPWSQQGWKSLNHNQIQHATAAYIIITVSYQTD